jgi:hypothetical protein
VDLLGESVEGTLIHLELQSTNDTAMPVRMLEYFVGIHRLLDRFPRQLCLYVGEAPLRMETELVTAGLKFDYPLIDIRTLDGEVLLESPNIGDNVIAILARLRDNRDAVRRILKRAAKLPKPERQVLLDQLYTFAGLRRLAALVEQEVRNMPLYIDISENEVLGPPFKRGELTILRRQLIERFGPLPAWAEDSLTAKSSKELEEISTRLLRATSLEEFLK